MGPSTFGPSLQNRWDEQDAAHSKAGVGGRWGGPVELAQVCRWDAAAHRW